MGDETPDGSGRALLWEVRAAPGRLDELVAWVDAHADPAGLVFAAPDADPRVVLVDPTGTGLPEPPAGLVARPPHAWPFQAVPRRS